MAASLRLRAPYLWRTSFCGYCGPVSDGSSKHSFSCKRSIGCYVQHKRYYRLGTAHYVDANLLGNESIDSGREYQAWRHIIFLPVWDVTRAHPLAPSWMSGARRDVSITVEAKKRVKYVQLDTSFDFELVSLETFGSIADSTAHFISSLGAKIAISTGDSKVYGDLR